VQGRRSSIQCASSTLSSIAVLQEMQRLHNTRPVTLVGRNYMNPPHNTVRIAHQNARSLHAHVAQFREDTYVPHMDIIACTDTRAHAADNDAQYNVPGFKMYRADDTSTHRGCNSIILYTRADFHASHTVFKSNTYCTIHAVITKDSMPTINVIATYRRPNTPATACLHHLSTLQPITHHNNGQTKQPTILIGDFNIDLRTNGPTSQNLTTLLQGHGFTQLVNTPTTPQGSLLDHVWSTTPGSVDLNPTYWSDHMATIAVISLDTT
jgi:exonuclease III